MKRKVNLMLWARKKRGTDAATSDPEISIYLRISVQGRRHQLNKSTGLSTTKSKWQAAGQLGRVMGSAEADQRINAELNDLQATLREAHAELERQGQPVTAKSLWAAYESKCAPTAAPPRRDVYQRPTFTWPQLWR